MTETPAHRPSSHRCASNTTPMPPAPIRSPTRNGPMRVPGSMSPAIIAAAISDANAACSPHAASSPGSCAPEASTNRFSTRRSWSLSVDWSTCSPSRIRSRSRSSSINRSCSMLIPRKPDARLVKIFPATRARHSPGRFLIKFRISSEKVANFPARLRCGINRRCPFFTTCLFGPAVGSVQLAVLAGRDRYLPCAARSLSDSTLTYCGKAGLGQILRSFSLNSPTIRLKGSKNLAPTGLSLATIG